MAHAGAPRPPIIPRPGSASNELRPLSPSLQGLQQIVQRGQAVAASEAMRFGSALGLRSGGRGRSPFGYPLMAGKASASVWRHAAKQCRCARNPGAAWSSGAEPPVNCPVRSCPSTGLSHAATGHSCRLGRSDASSNYGVRASSGIPRGRPRATTRPRVLGGAHRRPGTMPSSRTTPSVVLMPRKAKGTHALTEVDAGRVFSSGIIASARRPCLGAGKAT